MSKGDGRYIAIKFDKPLTSDPAAVVSVLEAENLIADWMKEITASEVSGTAYATKAVDGSTSTYWYPTTGIGAWLKIELLKPAVVRGFRYYSGASWRLKGYSFEGSNDGTNWTSLWSGENANVTQWNDISFENETAYLYYRWNVSSLWGSYLFFYEVQLTGDVPFGNEAAFTVTGQERDYILMPELIDGPLIAGYYEVLSVAEHPTETNAILLTMKEDKRIRNVSGDLTIGYDMSKGNLAGLGGAVVTFSESFTPADLVEEICRWWRPENYETITAAIVALTLTLSAIEHQVVGDGPYPNEGQPNEEDYQGTKYYMGGENSEKVDASITDLSIVLIHIDDLDP